MFARAEQCPGCGAALAPHDGPTHRYIGASAACWAIYTGMLSAGEPPVGPAEHGGLLVDAYAAQHPGVESPQATQSVAVHLIALYGVLERGVAVERALWLRQQALSERRAARRGRYSWLEPQPAAYPLSVADIAAAPTPHARAELVQPYVAGVWRAWAALHRQTIAAWYATFIGDRVTG